MARREARYDTGYATRRRKKSGSIIKKLLVLVIILFVLVAILFSCGSTQSETTTGSTSTLRNSITNAALNASGIKDKIGSALSENASTISSYTGLSESEVESAIDSLDIEDWSATDLPDDAESTGTYSTTYSGTDISVTTYTDSSYITFSAAGQEVTFSIPESAQDTAQTYLSYLGYL